MTHYRPHFVVLGLLAAAWLLGLPAMLAEFIGDKRFLWSTRAATGSVALVEIDAPSMAEIGVWPWPRGHHARLISRLEAAGVSDIVFDVDFSARSMPSEDAAFAEALAKAGGSVVLASFEQAAGDAVRGRSLHVNRPLPEFAAQSWPALVNVQPDGDGLVRRYGFGAALDGAFVPSLGALLAGRHDQGGGGFRIDFGIDSRTVPAVSYAAVLDGDPATLAQLKGRKVLIAGTAVELGDRFSTPNGRVIPGSLLQVLAAESLLQDRAIRRTGLPLSLMGVLAMLGAMILLWRRSGAAMRAVLMLATALALEIGALAIQARWAIDVDTSLWQLLIGAYLVVIALDEIDLRGLLQGIAERRFHRIAMSLGDGLVCLDSEGRIQFWNPGAARIFGYAENEALGMAFETCLAGGEPLDLPALARARGAGGPAETHLLELIGCRRGGERFALEASVSQWQGTDGRQFGLVVRDITVKQREREQIRYLAEHDDLTGLLNRHALTEQLAAALDKAEAGERAVLLVGIDRFHQFSDIHGRDFGDRVLRAFADRLRALAVPATGIARLSDDEFALVVPASAVVTLAGQIQDSCLAAPLVFGEWRQRVLARIGYAVAEQDGAADQLIGNAHLALEAARAERAERPVAFVAEMRERIVSRLALEAEIRVALDRGEFELFYQPQIRLADQAVIGAEALIRWRHPERGLVPPGQFIPVANHSSHSDAIGEWVLRTACLQARQWQEAGTPIRVGVNLSPSQLQGSELPQTVAGLLDETGLAPDLLELEVTEDILLDDAETVLAVFRLIRARGVKIAFDDFGTGYAGLSYLKRFPLDTLKVDQAFVRNLLGDAGDAAIVRATVELGRSLGLCVIAEGIEDAATAERLAAMGCQEGQGYHFGRPMPAEAFEQAFLRQRRVA